MSRPNRLKAGPWTYTIEWLDEDAWGTDKATSPDRCGIGDHTAHRVLIRTWADGRPDGDPASPGHLREVLLHEILHVAWYVTALEHDQPTDEETLISRLSPTLLAILRDNPQVALFLLADAD